MTNPLAPPPETQAALVGLYRAGRLDELATMAEDLVGRYPQSFGVWNILGAARLGLGRTGPAIDALREAARLNPENGDVLNNLGGALDRAGLLDEAIEAWRAALRAKPDLAAAHYNLGLAEDRRGNTDAAIAANLRAIALNPGYYDALNNLGALYYKAGRNDRAVEVLLRALALRPDEVIALVNLSNAYRRQDRQQEAIETARRALALDPAHAGAHNALGLALRDLGDVAAAEKALRDAIGLSPDQSEGYLNLSECIRFAPDDALLPQMRALAGASGLGHDDRSRIEFALAKACKDIGDYAAAFGHYRLANDFARKARPFDPAAIDRKLAELRATLPRLDAIAMHIGAPAAVTPIFIVGMPRSGTTLTEQIVSAHPQVAAAGELAFFPVNGDRIARGLEPIDSASLAELRARYLALLAERARDKPFVTDKLPFNFHYIGLINRILPEARIVHVRRDPRATCWSNYEKNLAARGMEYTNDLADIARYYRAYAALTDDLARRYPGRMIAFDYEALTADPEPRIRDLIAALGLPWDEACLAPQDNSRAVRTASTLQVRRGIYGGSSQAWRSFAPFIGESFAGLSEQP